MSIINDLESFLTSCRGQLNNDHFISHDNVQFSRRVFESEFQHRLETELADPKKAMNIAGSFEQHLRPYLNADQRKALENWLIKHVRFIGAIPFNEQHQGEIEAPIQQIFVDHPREVDAFFEQIKSEERPCKFPVNRDPNDLKNIVIITTTGGGGHKSVADGLAGILERFPEKYRVTTIDLADIEKLSDPLYRLSGLLSASEIYDRIYQQQQEPILATQLWKMKPKLTPFLPNTSMKDLKDRVRLLNPDLILSTCHFLDRDLELSSALEAPLRFVHCDYELSWALVSLITKVNPEIIKLWIPATDPEVLRPTSSKLKSELIQQLELTHSEKEIDELIENGTRTVIEYSGFPVRPAFERETDPNVLHEIKERFHVAHDAQVVVLQMGKQGVGSLMQIVEHLNENSDIIYDHPLHIAVICGTNVEMYQKIINYLETTRNHPQIHFVILPLLTQEDVADYLKIAEVEFMKPGGATTSEALEMGVKTLIFEDTCHPWENCNRDQMVRHGNGTILHSLNTISSQLKEVLASPKKSDYIPINARKIVPELVDQAIVTFQLYRNRVLQNSYLLNSLQASKGFSSRRTADEMPTREPLLANNSLSNG
jgi:UDP-N-acetylglucosamine:LPS N-acetylglucosamine transferase